jgi:hypothetical protein
MTATIDYGTRRPPVSKAALWTGRIVSAILVLLLLMGAVMDFARTAPTLEGLHKFGYPEHLAVPLGVIALACAVLYVIPPTAVLGAILLTGYFGGAIATHVRIGDPAFVAALVCGVLVWLSLYLRDPRVRELIPLRAPPAS